MATIIKVNGTTIKVHNKSNESNDNNVFTQLDKESKSLESLAINISKSIETLNLISDIKTMESFGYKSTEGVGEKIKSGLQFIWKKIKEFFIKIGNFIKDFFMTGGLKIRAANLLKKVEATDEKDIIFNIKVSEDDIAAAIAYKPMPINVTAHIIAGNVHQMKTLDVSKADMKMIEELDKSHDDLKKLEDDFNKKIGLKKSNPLYYYNSNFLNAEELGSKSKIIEYLKSVISGTDELTKIAKEMRSCAKEKISQLNALENSSDDPKLITRIQKYDMHYAKFLYHMSKCTVLFHNSTMYVITQAIKYGKKL